MSKVLYVHKCGACGKRGEQHLADSWHDGEMSRKISRHARDWKTKCHEQTCH